MILKLFVSFFKIGLFTFGGGYAMIPLIEREVIDRRRWVAREDFLSLLTVAQSAPGPIALNTSVFVGYKMCGFFGSLAALAGIVVPAFSVILAVAVFFADIRDNAVVDAAFRAMRPAVVALIIAPIAGLSKGLNMWLIAVAASVALLVWGMGLSPVLLLVAGAGAGLAWSIFAVRRAGGGKEAGQ